MQRGFAAIFAIIVLLVFGSAVGGAYYLGTQQNKNLEQKPTPEVSPIPSANTAETLVASPSTPSAYQTALDRSPILQKQVTSSPIPAVTPTDIWKDYNNPKVSLRYPKTWSVSYVSDDYNYLVVADKQGDKYNNSLSFGIRVIVRIPNNQNFTNEQIIEDRKNYEVSSTAGLGEYSPREISKEVITLSGQQAYKYKFQVQDLNYSHVTWVFLVINEQIIHIYLAGEDQSTLNKILQSIKILI